MLLNSEYSITVGVLHFSLGLLIHQYILRFCFSGNIESAEQMAYNHKPYLYRSVRLWYSYVSTRLILAKKRCESLEMGLVKRVKGRTF